VAIKYKKNGRYAYETHSVWNKEQKKYQKKWEYLGVVDKMTGKIAKKKNSFFNKKEKLILNYGDSQALNEYSEKSGLKSLVNQVYGGLSDSIFALVFYKLLESGAMCNAENWFDGNYAKILFATADLASQRISETLVQLGDEQLLREFFKLYASKIYSKTGVVIDSTGLPNEINSPLNALGYHGGTIENETRLLMVVDKQNAEPLYFRYMAGNIVDVSTLQNTIKELERLNINAKYALIDAGYFSEDNICRLYESQISFIIRLPAGRKLYAETIKKTIPALEKRENAIIHGERVLYVQRVEVNLYEKHVGYAYVCLDVARKADDIKRIVIAAKDDNEPHEKTEKKLKRAGIFALLSSEKIDRNDVLPLYYMRQSAEQIFQISKSYADILPLRVHSEKAFRGLLFLNFLAVILYINFRKQLPTKFTVESALRILRNQSCKIFDDNSVLPAEPTKNQRLLSDAISDTVGKFSGG
jgi:hypothetical protein